MLQSLSHDKPREEICCGGLQLWHCSMIERGIRPTHVLSPQRVRLQELHLREKIRGLDCCRTPYALDDADYAIG